MNSLDIIRLVTLAAIWGSSFIFMRVLAPVLGPFITANGRVFIAGLVLWVYSVFTKFDLKFREYWRHYLVIGVVNSAIPFSLFSYAALYIPASYSVILNSTAPLFGAIFSWLWLSEQMNTQKVLGLLISAFGVGLVVNVGLTKITGHFMAATIACLGATLCYGLAGVYIKKCALSIKPMGITIGSLLLAGLVLIPVSALQTTILGTQGLVKFPHMVGISGLMDPLILVYLLGLALLCSATAYLLFYRLVLNIGPAKTLTVSFLAPVFGMIWSVVFLKDVIRIPMIIGTFLILLGTLLILAKNWFVLQKTSK